MARTSRKEREVIRNLYKTNLINDLLHLMKVDKRKTAAVASKK